MTDILVDGLGFGEGPRWRNGRLYFTDVAANTIHSVGLDGDRETIAHIDGQPSGLGWLSDGTLLIARAYPAAIVRADGSVYADLSDIAAFGCNDMVVYNDRVFVGTCDFAGIPAPQPSQLIEVDAEGKAHVVDDAMRFPNGSVVTDDGRTLVVAETFGAGLQAFDISGGGPASGKRQWAAVEGSLPDGICLDAEGAVWFADALGQSVVRVREGGDVVARIATERPCFACTLGGPDMRTLFVVTGAFAPHEENLRNRPGRIDMFHVEVPGVESP